MTQGSTVSIDLQTSTIYLNLTFDPSSVGSQPVDGLDGDFLGSPIPQDGSAVPGPFQNLKKGENVITGLWSGIDVEVSARHKSAFNAAGSMPKKVSFKKAVIMQPANAIKAPWPGSATTKVYNLKGELIGTMNSGDSANKRPLAKGIYMIRIDAAESPNINK
jgi:hypothetical protein